VGGGKLHFSDFKGQNISKFTYCIALDPWDSNLRLKTLLISKNELKKKSISSFFNV
jgi:hypothetical protein